MPNLADLIVEESTDAATPGDSNRARRAVAEAVATGSASTDTTSAAPATTEDDSFLPEKFRGKSKKELWEAYQNLESSNGRMANELGTQRQLTDRLLDLKRGEDLRRNTPTKPSKPEVSTTDILEKPAETLDRVLSEREAALEARYTERLRNLEIGMAQERFRARHSDFQSVIADKDFQSWVQSSPIRLRAAAAANQGDWTIATELLDEWKGRPQSAPRTEATRATPTSDVAGARRATLETSGSTGGEVSVAKGKQYTRADLMRWRIEDPESYYDEANQVEILKAYHEGRVR